MGTCKEYIICQWEAYDLCFKLISACAYQRVKILYVLNAIMQIIYMYCYCISRIHAKSIKYLYE